MRRGAGGGTVNCGRNYVRPRPGTLLDHDLEMRRNCVRPRPGGFVMGVCAEKEHIYVVLLSIP